MSVATRAGVRREQAASEGARRGPGSGFRGDIQGLRAVAVVLVLLYHAGVPFLPGGYIGVDVFFVISGFLITGLIVREVGSTGRLALGRFYARRARRLLPATALVFVFVAAMTVVVLPVTRWESIASDLAAASLYVVNWTLAARSVDYLAQGAAESPLQHFWSLAVEEQFYIVWPVLLVALIWLLRRRGRGISTGGLFAGLLVIAVPSFVWSVHLTATDPGPAYFVTTTRLWELAVGALLAVGAGHVAQLPGAVRSVVGWAGLVAIALGAWKFTAETPFPGTAALVPTLGAAAVIVAGLGRSPGLAPLRVPAMQDIGTLSYSLYLWHWPLLVGATVLWGDDEGHLWLPTALLVVGFSAVPAWLAYRVVEQPVHTARSLATKPWRAAVVGVVCVAIGLGASLAVSSRVSPTPPAASDVPLGAELLGDDPSAAAAGAPTDNVEGLVPAAQVAADDNPDVYEDGCHQSQKGVDPLSCSYGDADGDVVIALVGDSHAAQWQPALRRVVEERGWQLVTYTKSACLFGEVTVWLGAADAPYDSCREWTERVSEKLVAEQPDLVVTSVSGGFSTVRDGAPVSRPDSEPDLAAGLAAEWIRLQEAGLRVAALMDTPSFGIDAPECVAQNPSSLTQCLRPRDKAVAASARPFQELALRRAPDVPVIDLTSYVCPRESCTAAVGGVLVWRDGSHLTATYARTLASRLDEEIVKLL